MASLAGLPKSFCSLGLGVHSWRSRFFAVGHQPSTAATQVNEREVTGFREGTFIFGDFGENHSQPGVLQPSGWGCTFREVIQGNGTSVSKESYLRFAPDNRSKQ